MIERVADVLRPMMLRPPPARRLQATRATCFELLREAGRAAGLSRRGLHELFRVMTMSVGDLLDDCFENDALKGAYASTGVVGVWAGPRTPGTAYNLLHHELGELDGVGGAWGHVRGGMGAISEAIAGQRARRRRDDPHRRAGRVDRRRRRPRAPASRSPAARRCTAPIVLSGAHPKTTVLDLVGAEHFPDEVVEDMRRYRSRGGVGEGQLDPVRAAALRRARRAERCCTRASRSARRSTTSSAPGRTRRAASPPRARTSRSRCRRRSTRR